MKKKKKVLIVIGGFFVAVFIFEILSIIEKRKDPDIDQQLLSLVNKNSELSNRLGSLRSSTIDYNSIVNDTTKFDAHFSGSEGKLDFTGYAIRLDNKWKILTYSIVKDSL